jgi:hypothetical protein
VKKILIALATITAFSAPALAQSVGDGSSVSLHAPVDYAAIQANQDGTPIGLKILMAERLYDQYND